MALKVKKVERLLKFDKEKEGKIRIIGWSKYFNFIRVTEAVE